MEDASAPTNDPEAPTSKSKSKPKAKSRDSSLPIYTENAITQYDPEEIREDIATLEQERDAMAKHANMAAIAEYRRKEEDYLKRYVELSAFIRDGRHF